MASQSIPYFYSHTHYRTALLIITIDTIYTQQYTSLVINCNFPYTSNLIRRRKNYFLSGKLSTTHTDAEIKQLTLLLKAYHGLYQSQRSTTNVIYIYIYIYNDSFRISGTLCKKQHKWHTIKSCVRLF